MGFFLQSRKNLSDVANAAAALANLGGSVSGQYLRTPSQYGSSTQQILGSIAGTFQVPGLFTTVAAGSNGGVISAIASWAAPSAGVLAVASTTGFASSGTLFVVASGSTVATITYTGTTAGTFTGCAYVSGSAAGTVATGGSVVQASAAALVSTGAFTAPPSGSVIVTVSLVAQYTTSSSAAAWALFGHGTSTQFGFNVEFPPPVASNRFPVTLTFPVTGLTPGTSYNFDLAAISGLGQTLSIYALSSSSSSPNLSTPGNGCPVTMLVQAV